jgi:hypothetical protein
MQNKPDGLALPLGARRGPNCGVTAVAAVTGKPFEDVWNYIRAKYYQSGRWGGGTRDRERADALTHFGMWSLTLKLDKRQSLKNWVLTKAQPGATYIVRTGGHVQVVRDGWCLDQTGPHPVAKYWGRNCFATHITLVVPA